MPKQTDYSDVVNNQYNHTHTSKVQAATSQRHSYYYSCGKDTWRQNPSLRLAIPDGLLKAQVSLGGRPIRISGFDVYKLPIQSFATHYSIKRTCHCQHLELKGTATCDCNTKYAGISDQSILIQRTKGISDCAKSANCDVCKQITGRVSYNLLTYLKLN